jgi:hypothetical protein
MRLLALRLLWRSDCNRVYRRSPQIPTPNGSRRGKTESARVSDAKDYSATVLTTAP